MKGCISIVFLFFSLLSPIAFCISFSSSHASSLPLSYALIFPLSIFRSYNITSILPYTRFPSFCSSPHLQLCFFSPSSIPNLLSLLSSSLSSFPVPFRFFYSQSSASFPLPPFPSTSSLSLLPQNTFFLVLYVTSSHYPSKTLKHLL